MAAKADAFPDNTFRFRRMLLAWYDKNRRDLPWRQTRDPYRIWISEIMLQQTRVAAVIARYERFLRRFPSVKDLARARESSVLAEWSGLGYYRRARNLRLSAKTIVRQHGGEFPQSCEGLRTLPGIGRYTAAAIASIAFNEPVAVVDGNVERVISRLMGRAHKGELMWAAAQSLLDTRRPGDFNQAIMELGATVCLPKQPQCFECPIRSFCRTRGRHPAVTPKRPQQTREISYLLVRRLGDVLLVRRPENQNLMPGMWELPQARSAIKRREPLFSVKHSITITDFKVNVFSSSKPNTSGAWVPISRLNSLPLTGLARKILRRAEII